MADGRPPRYGVGRNWGLAVLAVIIILIIIGWGWDWGYGGWGWGYDGARHAADAAPHAAVVGNGTVASGPVAAPAPPGGRASAR